MMGQNGRMRQKSVPTYFMFALLASSLLWLVSCSPVPRKTDLDVIQSQGNIKVGTLYGRTTYFNGANGPVGFEYELLQGFAQYLNVELEVYPYYNVTELYEQLENGHIDLVASGQPISEQERDMFSVGPAYLSADHYLVFKQGSTMPDALDGLDVPITVVAGSTHANYLLALQEEKTNLNWTTTEELDAVELIEHVANGDLPYTLADSNTLAIHRRRFPQLSIAKAVYENTQIAWLINSKRDDLFLASMLDYFSDIRGDGSLKVLEDKYFGHIRQFDYVDTREFIKAAQTVLPAFKPWFIEYAGDIDWRLLAAISYQESHWKPDAKSHTGVRGMMMLTQGTARDMGIKRRTDAKQSIRGGAKYVASLMSRIPARIQSPDRIWMALAAYNIGLGHLEDGRVLTQRAGGNPDLWIDVKQYLPRLTQKKYYKQTRYGFANGDVAVKYVENIRRYYDTLVWLDTQPLEHVETSLETE